MSGIQCATHRACQLNRRSFHPMACAARANCLASAMTVGHHLPSAIPRLNEAICCCSGRVAKDLGVIKRVNSVQAARPHVSTGVAMTFRHRLCDMIDDFRKHGTTPTKRRGASPPDIIAKARGRAPRLPRVPIVLHDGRKTNPPRQLDGFFFCSGS
jgi:hypothetical protein